MKILQLLDYWLQSHQSVSAKEAASLHDKLVHVSCIFPLIWPFLHGVALFPLSFSTEKAASSPPLHANLSWVCFVIQSIPNEVPLVPTEPIDLQWWGGASTSFGIGLVLGTHWAVWKWSPGFKVGPHQDFNIGWAKAVAVKLGLWLALNISLFGNGIL